MPTPYTTNIGGELKYNLNNPFGGVTVVTGLLSQILGIILLLGGVYVFVCLLWGGYQWLTAGDNEGSLQQAKDRLSHCLLGFTVLALSYAIALLVQYFLGIQIFEPLPDLPGTPGVPTPTWGGPTPPCSADCTQACEKGKCVTFTPTNTRTPTPTPELKADGEPCGNGSECLSTVCGQDQDVDNYLADVIDPSTPQTCQPASKQPGDCHDKNSSVNRKHDVYEASSYTAPDGTQSYDWNCDGNWEKMPINSCVTSLPAVFSCIDVNSSTPLYRSGLVNPNSLNCGQAGEYRYCKVWLFNDVSTQ